MKTLCHNTKSLSRPPWRAVHGRPHSAAEQPQPLNAACPLPPAPCPLRPAFTLVEMLVVITIIGVLASLISVAAFQGLQAAKRARTQAEISNLASAVEQYKQKNGDYPPSFLDHRDLNARARMIQHLAKAFPRCNPNVEVWYIPWCDTTKNTSYYPYLDSSGTVQLWDPASGNTEANTNAQPLTPAQALVFWLTSISKDPVHPLSAPTADRQSFFDFDTTRLSLLSTTAPGWNTVTVSGTLPTWSAGPTASSTSNIYPKYNPGAFLPRDGNQQAYVYFEAQCYLYHAMFLTSANSPGAIPYLSQSTPWDTNGNGVLDAGPPTNNPIPDVTTDSSTDIISKSFTDFQKLCVNPKSFQIICAGADNDFGTVNTGAGSTAGNSPGVAAPGVPVTYNNNGSNSQSYFIYYKSYPDGQGYNTTSNADDDNLTNFTEKTLGQAKP